MNQCPFCGFDEGWTRLSPWDLIEKRPETHYVVQCNVCHAIGPESKTRAGAEEKWDGILSQIDPNIEKEEFKEKLNEETFERGRDPKISTNIGIAPIILEKTRDSFSFKKYGEKNWVDVIRWLLSEGYNQDEISEILRSKLMRYAADKSNKSSDVNLKDFKIFNKESSPNGKSQVEYFLDSEIRPNRDRFNEEAAGGVSSPISTLNNTPGMGNAQPATKATTGSMGTSNTGSGDSWGDASTGKISTQKANEENESIFMPPINENNISPYDKLGVAMAKKIGAALPFKKGKGDKDVEQEIIDEDMDLSSEMMTFEEWEKQFLQK